jgi:NADH:ubiquinone oxidoreductase subunit 6 (subunit J)
VRFTRLALVLGLLVLAGVCALAGIGFTPAIAVLVTVAVLVLFVAVGNLVSGRPGKPRFARPPAEATEPAARPADRQSAVDQ